MPASSRKGSAVSWSSMLLVHGQIPCLISWLLRLLHNIRLVQGSHIIVNALFEHDQPYILQHDDGRIVFAIPYLDKFTLLGTTDTEYSGDPAKAEITSEEQAYILEVVNRYFSRQLTQKRCYRQLFRGQAII